MVGKNKNNTSKEPKKGYQFITGKGISWIKKCTDNSRLNLILHKLGKPLR